MLKFDPQLIANVEKYGIHKLYKLQEQAIPIILDDAYKNVLIASETGSGKSLAYMLPLLQMIMNDMTNDTLGNNPVAIILVPNMILAHQVCNVLLQLIRNLPITVDIVDNIETQKMPEILIGTTIKVLRKLKIYGMNFKQFIFNHIKYLVLDECDQIVEQINRTELKEFLKYTKNRIKTICAAATISTAGTKSVKNTMMILFKKLKIVSSSNLHSIPLHVTPEFIYFEDDEDRSSKLLDYIKKMNSEIMLVFCNTVASCNKLAETISNAEVPLQEQIEILNLEQGCGRAGRDMQQSKSIAFWTNENLDFYKMLISNKETYAIFM
ncbi:bifunctional DEAD-DEAH box helicase domain/Helicase superfamily 1-2 [Babesia duncani]|uniref:ATP-dependent RNA helicase n=1 Tax=Babesia duncani TaxID=323732 RepID=A0AAD9PM00_9APIC|nr:bifunctional DEAD-DEAH box helicase domain/Helicase superfamily 1-2 [Babesia duncani]